MDPDVKRLAQQTLAAAWANDQRQKMRLFRHVTALSYGLNPHEYDDEPPPPVMPPLIAAAPAAAKEVVKSGIGKALATFALAGLLGGGAGSLGALAITKLASPPSYKLEADWHYDPADGKGLQIGPLREAPEKQ
jgi:hypothetical protein